MDKNYRIHTNISSDTILNVNMQQDYDFLEVLTLKLRQKDAYKLHSSNYGVIIGRVLANDAFGIPNAKISVFIERDSNDTSVLEAIYPYSEVTTKDRDGRRYNLLPDDSDDDCYRIVGTFPNKRLVLDDDTELAVYDKYWKYTTVTNNAGDYMLFGIPSGNQQLHVDIDLSDIGILSQKPRDFEYKGYNVTMFDNPSQFKESTNLESLAQIFSQNKSVFVYPFWGDADNGIAAITRADIEIQYKFEPTCVFMGSIVSDNEGNAIGHKCAPAVDNGMNDQLVAGEGTIEMIRKTTDGLIEEYQIQGNQLIDSDGVWCYQIPMNLDYVGTDEYGNIVPTDNPSKGIPTRTQVRFRFSKNETGDEGFSRHTAKYLVPMNPPLMEGKKDDVVPKSLLSGQDFEKLYSFGTNTPESCFRDLYWNNVYSVKNYIPKAQVAHRPYSKNYTALKGSNLVENQNPIPFNKLRIDIPFMYMIVCILFTVVMWVVAIINLIICGINKIFSILNILHNLKILWVRPFGWIPAIPYIGCISLGGGLTEDNTAFYPGCECSEGLNASDCPDDMEGNCIKRASKGELLDRVQQRLAEDYKIVKLDLYQDWVNGCLYMPLWYWRKRKKKTFLFFTLSSAKNEYCSCDSLYTRLKTYVTCNFLYSDKKFKLDGNNVPEKENNWHRNSDRAVQIRYRRGLIKEVENKDGLKVYYYSALQARDDGKSDPNLEMDKRGSGFTVARLYSTDIILLGNLNEENLYGIPQFFKVLPSTTANIPPIATIYEQIENDDEQGKYVQNEVAGGEDSGTSITTGMDWKRDGDEDEPNYKGGLFMDLACVYAHTRAKSCINVERMSELGVNLDMTHKMSYSHNGNGIQTGMLDSDGFISKYELDDMENRAMFATMNHIGFVPQTYQDKISGHTTQVEDSNTNYLVPKFKYIYPVDFDGRMQVLMERYANGFKQSLYDEMDDAYVTFRMGATSGKTESGRTRHFYYEYGNSVEMPLYNNSFFFYFGIRKGSTAIDKFNKLFYAECFKNDKKPFAYELNTKGRTYCPLLYKDSPCTEDNGHGNQGYGYIKVSSDDIRTPFSYVLIDSNGFEIIREGGMTDTEFVIGGTLKDDGSICHNTSGSVMYQSSHEAVINDYGTSGLTNQTYTLTIIDADGRKVSDRVKLDMNKISFEYEGRKLGTKFYNTENSRIDYICNKDNEYYGEIKITKFFIDTYEYKITAATCDVVSDEKYTVYVSGEPVDENCPLKPTRVLFELYPLFNDSSTNGTPSVRDCMCDKGNSIPFKDGITVDYFEFVEGENLFKFNVYQPLSFVGVITQECGDNIFLLENSTSEVIKIPNGENFNTFLNNMPTRFILGTTTDGENADIANTSNFYRSNLVTSPIADGLNGWFGVHQEDTYQFKLPINQPIPRNKGIWSDFLTVGSDITNVDTRKNILRYKFDRMFKLSDTVYLTSSNNKKFRYSAVGGVEPILYRTIAPYYSKYNIMFNAFSYSDKNYVSYPEEFPQVVGINYYENGSRGPVCIGTNGETEANEGVRFNKLYERDREKLGNYFAAFTKNGRYTASTAVDCDISIAALPNYAAVNVEDSVKRLGRERQANSIPERTYKVVENSDCGKKSQPHLRTLNIDRRLDFDFVVFAPAMNKNIRLHNDPKKERPWKCGRISGWTYGGIEMSYDEDYNIISATTDENNGSATPNNRLEYSYHVTSDETDEARTVYNIPQNGEIVWVNRRDTSAWKLYNQGYNDDETSKQCIKTLYEATINDIDIRQLFWSTFNYNRLNAYREVQPSFYSTLDKSDFYVFQHANEGFNGDFNRSTANEFPTKRLLDIGNIAPSDEYYFNLTSCGYGMSPIVREDGVIECYAEPGEITEFSLQFINPIEFIPPNADNEDYANAIMKSDGNVGDYKKFSIEAVDLSFRLNKIASYDFDIYTTPPRIVKILSQDILNNHEGMDGLTYIKRSTTDLTQRLNNITIYQVDGGNAYLSGDLNIANDWWYNTQPDDGWPWNLSKHQDIPYFSRNDDYVVSDDNDFYNTWYQLRLDGDEGLNSDVYVIALLVLRRYKSNTTDHLIRRISSIECSNMYDVRHVLLKILTGTDYTYIVKETNTIESQIISSSFTASVSGTAEVTVNVPSQNNSSGSETRADGDGGGSSSTSASGTGQVTGTATDASGTTSGENETHFQVVTFQMYVDQSITEPSEMQNQTIADYKLMGFTFRFTNDRGENYYLTPEISGGTNGEINFKIVFSQEMGVLADTKWGEIIPCHLFAKTSDNFTYDIPFYLNLTKQDGKYSSESKTSELKKNERGATYVQILEI